MTKNKLLISIISLSCLLFAFNPFAMEEKMDKKTLKEKLTPLQYSVTQENATETPFKNKYWDNKKDGIYIDIITKKPLFSSKDKFQSSSGWPSFSKPIEDETISLKDDNSHFMKRTEVRNKEGSSHLGHVFNDGPKDKTGLRYCINSASLEFIPKEQLKEKGYEKYLALFDEKKPKIEYATFAAGCFWGVQHIFDKINGVIKTTAGYTGGQTVSPKYENITTGKTGHAEAVLIEYDANIISYNELLNYFWRLHNPTTLNRQGYDIGTQYRSAIFYHDEEQKNIATKSKKHFDSSGVFEKEAVTQIKEAKEFYIAESYHQKYIDRTGRKTCHFLRDK